MCGFVVSIDVADLSDAGWDSGFHSLASRGPDASGELHKGSARFGHKRLAIIGLGPHGKQPVDNGDSILVFNGEIYNYRDLAQQLGIQATSDTDVLFEIAQRDLREWLPKLRGMYAFVHFHAPTGTISAARDPFGIKPLYVREHSNGGHSLGSTVASLANVSQQPPVDPVAVAHFLAWGFIPSGRSIFESIYKIPPGTLAVWSREQPKDRSPKYWQIPFGDWPQLHLSDALNDSVQAHLVSDVEVGVFLSGGIDSTLITSFAREFTPTLKSFTLSNPLNPSIDESQFAALNSKLLGTEHIDVPASPQALIEQAKTIIETSGEPFSDAAFLPLALLSKAASEHVKVCLAGEGADELFAGYRRYDVESRLKNPVIRAALRQLATRTRAEHFLEARNTNWSRILHAAQLSMPLDQHAALMYASWQVVFDALGEPANQAWDEQVRNWDGQTGAAWGLGFPKNREFDLRTWLPNVFLEKSDRASMAYGLEVRVPFLDPVVALAAGKYKPRNSAKTPLRNLLKQRVPGVQLPMRKKGLAVSLETLLPYLSSDIDFVLHSHESLLNHSFDFASAQLHQDLSSSPSLGFRLAVLSIWQQTVQR